MSSKTLLRGCLLGLLPLLFACPTPNNPHGDGGVDGGPHPAPVITMTEPNNAQRDGVYNFNVLGKNFFGNVRVFLGGVEASKPVVISPLRISAKTQVVPTAGPMDVKVINGDGQTATLAHGFTFLDPVQVVRTIDACKIQYPSSIVSDGGVQPVYGHVLGANLTNVSGPVAGLSAQLGLGSAGMPLSAWTWLDAAYNDGCTTCNDTSKEFVANLIPPTSDGTYQYAYRFNYNGGAYTYCDTTGIWDGSPTGTPGTLTVGKSSSSSITACKLQFPSTISDQTGNTSPPVYGHVLAPGVTDQSGTPTGLVGQVGFGATGTDPSTWTNWAPGSFNPSCTTCTDGSAEFSATFTLPAPGAYDYTYRFSLNGSAYTYCDLNGKTDGTTTGAGLGKLTSSGQAISSCQLLTSSITGQPGQTAFPSAAGTVTIPGLTGSGGAKSSIVAQVGYGDPASQPDNTWHWTTANYTGPSGSGADDYSASVTAPNTPGDFALAYRFSFNGGNYVYCGLTAGTSYTPGKGGTLHVPSNNHCSLLSLSSTSPVSGTPITATASIVVPGATGGTSAAPNILTQVGIGNGGTQAQSDPSWGWGKATYKGRGSSSDDVYTATFNPSITGSRTLDFRFSTDSGKTWIYCDTSSAGNGSLSVGNVTGSYCNIQFPQTVSQGGTNVYGQVYVAGVTNAATPNPSAITAQLVYGSPTTDPDLTWTPVPATFNVVSGSNLEYQASFPSTPGTYGYAFRYQVNGQANWCYGQWKDAGGSTSGFSPANFGSAKF